MAYGNVNAPGMTPSEVAGEIVEALKNYPDTSGVERLLSSKVEMGARTQIPTNADLNNTAYVLNKGFAVNANNKAATIKNSPVRVAFIMDVFSSVGNDTVVNGAWNYIFRRIITYVGEVWVQSASTNGSGVWSFGAWQKVTMGGPYIPTSQKGAANGVASLDANGDVPFAQMPPYLLYGAKYLGGTENWNTLTPGVYYTTGGALGANAPTGAGIYGTLIDCCGAGGVARLQIFYGNGSGVLAVRSRFETTQSWTAWRYFNVNGTSAAIATAPNNTSYTTKQVRNITLSTAAASGGGNGDLFFTYV